MDRMRDDSKGARDVDLETTGRAAHGHQPTGAFPLPGQVPLNRRESRTIIRSAEKAFGQLHHIGRRNAPRTRGVRTPPGLTSLRLMGLSRSWRPVITPRRYRGMSIARGRPPV